jgi:hypothetical protein
MPVRDGLPASERRRHIPPRDTTTGPPEHPVEHRAVIDPPPTTTRDLVGQQRFQTSPFRIGQIVSMQHLPGLPHPALKIRGTRSRPGSAANASRWAGCFSSATVPLPSGPRARSTGRPEHADEASPRPGSVRHCAIRKFQPARLWIVWSQPRPPWPGSYRAGGRMAAVGGPSHAAFSFLVGLGSAQDETRPVVVFAHVLDVECNEAHCAAALRRSRTATASGLERRRTRSPSVRRVQRRCASPNTEGPQIHPCGSMTPSQQGHRRSEVMLSCLSPGQRSRAAKSLTAGERLWSTH